MLPEEINNPVEKEKQKTEDDYKILLLYFLNLKNNYSNLEERNKITEQLIHLKTSFLLERLLPGLNFESAKFENLLYKRQATLSAQEIKEQAILKAGINNLIDFAAAKTNTLIKNIVGTNNKQDPEESIKTLRKYNFQYALEENMLVSHAALMASWWLTIPETTYITYMTQADERVRAWHLSLEGLTYLKKDFPSELIPPIEWGCRCYLIEDGYRTVTNSISKREVQSNINPVFRDSLALAGKIFSSEHPYFKESFTEEIRDIIVKLKTICRSND